MQGYTEFRGEPWPPRDRVPQAPAPTTTPAVAADERRPGRRMVGYTAFRGEPWPPVREAAQPAPAPAAAASPAEVTEAAAAAVPLEATAPAGIAVPGRRMAGYTAFRGEPWPPARVGAAPQAPEPAPMATVEPAVATGPTPTVEPVAAGAPETTPKPAPSTGRRVAAAVGGVVVLGLLAVLGARWLLTLPEVAAFVARYPGVPRHPEVTPVGIPAWLAWQHFLNLFLLVLVVRTGLQVRHETRPPATFTPHQPGPFAPRSATGGTYSLTVWIHQALDALWLLNGLVFVVLLFATGHWMRLIPTDPQTPQHMVSTALQYLSLQWPEHDGWLHYNALQMVTYAGVVFVLAPLAALTGFRMSSWWPSRNAALSRGFPMELARRLHYPTMLAFVLFVVVHVVLVLFSGVLHELNGMFLARNAADAWGLAAFLVGCAVIAAGWVLLKPAIVAPVAERFGRVSR